MARAENHSTPKANAQPKPMDPLTAARKRQLSQPPGPEELARRQKVLARFQKLWDTAPYVETDPSELLRQSREEDEAGY